MHIVHVPNRRQTASQKVLAQDLQLRMQYIRKPDGEKRGKGKSRVGVMTNKVFPRSPITAPPLAEDRPGFERHMKALSVECKRGHNANPEVSQYYSWCRHTRHTGGGGGKCFHVDIHMILH